MEFGRGPLAIPMVWGTVNGRVPAVAELDQVAAQVRGVDIRTPEYFDVYLGSRFHQSGSCTYR